MTFYNKTIFFFLFSFFITTQTIFAEISFDVQIKKYDSIPIIIQCSNKNNETWCIAGRDSNIVLKIVNFGNKIKVVKNLKSSQNIRFNSILCIDRNLILFGTKNDYVYCVRNNKFLHINKSYGVIDSIINAIEWNIIFIYYTSWEL